MSRAGLLTGMPAFDLGIGLSVRPSMSSRRSGVEIAPGVRWSGARSHASLDATQRLGANTLASLTVNTDFAETEVDTRAVEPDAVPALLPREANVLSRGRRHLRLRARARRTDVMPFFSRRIGCSRGNEVPLDAGRKVNGRAAGTSLRRARRHGRATSDTLATASTMGVVRIKRNVLGESSVGFIATDGRSDRAIRQRGSSGRTHVPDVALSRRQELARRRAGDSATGREDLEAGPQRGRA